jgi:hypothetical protein
MSLSNRRIVAAALLAIAALYAGSQVSPAVAVSTVALSAACGGVLMWLVIKRHIWGGKPLSARQMTTLHFGYLPSYLFEQVWNAVQYRRALNDLYLHLIHSMEVDADRRANLEHLQ